MKFIVTLSDMVGVVLIALLVFVWIIFGMIILVNIVKDNIKYRIDKWKREREVMKEWERMERLTERTADGILVKENHGENGLRTFYQCFEEKPNDKYTNCDGGYCAIEKLAAYEDSEEQGLLLRLPCKVGDTVYVVTSPFNVFDDIEYDENMKDEVYEAYVSSVSFYESGEQYRIYAKVTNHFIGAYFRECDFGKTVFLTKSEAEAKLAEMRGAE